MQGPLNSRLVTLALVLAGAVMLAGCDEQVATTTQPSTASVTETFTGDLATSQSAVHPFTVPKMGNVTLTLLAITPIDEAITLTLAIGTWNGTTCTILAENAATKLGTTLFGAALAGSFCARLSDAGTIPESISYTLQVVRPE